MIPPVLITLGIKPCVLCGAGAMLAKLTLPEPTSEGTRALACGVVEVGGLTGKLNCGVSA